MMDNNFEASFFDTVRELFSGHFECNEENIEDKKTLDILFDLPIEGTDETIEYDCTVSVDEDQNTALVQLLFVFRDSIPKDRIADVVRLTADLNKIMLTGYFGVMEDEGCAYFNCAFNTAKDTDEASLKSAARVLDRMSLIACQSISQAEEYISALLLGEITAGDPDGEEVAVYQDIGTEEE